MTQTVGQDLARKTVLTRMSQLRFNAADVARNAEVDPKTVAAFLEGKRWPQRSTRAAISEAVEWPAEYVDLLAAGTLDPTAALVENEDSRSNEVMTFADIAEFGPRVSGLERQVESLWLRVIELEQQLQKGGGEHGDRSPSTRDPDSGPDPGVNIGHGVPMLGLREDRRAQRGRAPRK
jgi:hypothetical protein